MSAPAAARVRRTHTDALVVAAALSAALMLASAASITPVAVAALALCAAATILGAVTVSARPERAAYAYLALAPLVAGVGRGAVVPLVRPHELLLAGLLGAVVVGAARGRVDLRPLARPAGVDKAVVALAVTSSVTPMLWMIARGAAVGLQDVLFALTLWKYLAVYLMVRLVLRTPAQARTAVTVVLAATAAVAVLGIVQALGVGPFAARLGALTASDENNAVAANRAASTIGTPIGFADVMIIAGALAVGRAHYDRGCGSNRAPRHVALAGLFAIATLASGQVSAALGLLVAAVAVGARLRRLPSVLLPLGVLGVLGALALRPVIAGRVAALDPTSGLPVSWTGPYGRLANLRTYIWPQILDGANWLFGVRPSSRVPSLEPWRDWVYIESGYTWLLWNGGLPLAAAYVAYVALGLLATRRAAPDRSGRFATGNGGVLGRDDAAVATAALGAFCGLVVVATLMLLDPHLTIRGSADLLFPLVAISVTASTRPHRTSTPHELTGARPEAGLAEAAQTAEGVTPRRAP